MDNHVKAKIVDMSVVDDSVTEDNIEEKLSSIISGRILKVAQLDQYRALVIYEPDNDTYIVDSNGQYIVDKNGLFLTVG